MIDNVNADDREVKQLIVRLKPELKQKFYIKCIENNTSMRKVVSDLINEYVEKN